MTYGATANVLVCVPSTSSMASYPCPTGQAPAIVSAFLIDSSQAANYQASMAPFDYVVAGQVWAFAITSILILHFVSHGIGLALKQVR